MLFDVRVISWIVLFYVTGLIHELTRNGTNKQTFRWSSLLFSAIDHVTHEHETAVLFSTLAGLVSRTPQFIQRRANRRLHQVSFLIALVGIARPEESPQSVLSSSRHYVDVQVGHALTDTIVHRDECAVGLHARFDGARQKLNIHKEGLDQLGRQIEQRFIMPFWNQQTVPGKHRTMIQKTHTVVVFKNDPRRKGAVRNPTEEACWVCHVR